MLTRLRDEEGQALPVLILVAGVLVAATFWLAEVGRAASLRVDAQSAADAAALAGAEDLRRQVVELDIVRFGHPLLDPCPAAEHWATRNGADPSRIDCRVSTLGPFTPGRHLREVHVELDTAERLEGDVANRIGVSGSRGTASAKAQLELVWNCDPAPGVDAELDSIVAALALEETPEYRQLGCRGAPGRAAGPHDAFATTTPADRSRAETAMYGGTADLCRPYPTSPDLFAHRRSQVCGGQTGDLAVGEVFGNQLRDAIELDVRLLPT